MYIYICIYVCIYICICVCIFAYVCTQTYIYCIGVASTAYDEDTGFATPAHPTSLHTSTPSITPRISRSKSCASTPLFFGIYIHVYISKYEYLYISTRKGSCAQCTLMFIYENAYSHLNPSPLHKPHFTFVPDISRALIFHNEPDVSAKEPRSSTKEPNFSAKEPCVSA